jgi:DNA mismatch endonuclease (patch repair protein)
VAIFYVADRHGLDHDYRFELRGQGWMSHGGCGKVAMRKFPKWHYAIGMDNLGRRRRSEIMSSIRSGDTQPEKAVRSIVHRMGYRFRLHVRSLPGTPDIVLPRHKKIIFVHGCFWHGHVRCLKGRPPKSNLDFWIPKLAANRKRDQGVAAKLRRIGWEVLVVWQCQLRRGDALRAALRAFLRH